MFGALDLRRDRLYGHVKRRRGRTQFLEFCRYLRSLYPPEVRIALVLDNFSPHLSTRTDPRVADWAGTHSVELAYVPFYATWLNRIEPSSALRYFAWTAPDHPTHRDQASMIRRDIAWRNRHVQDSGSATSPSGRRSPDPAREDL